MAVEENKHALSMVFLLGLTVWCVGCRMQDDLHIRTTVLGGGLMSDAGTRFGTVAEFSPDGTILATGFMGWSNRHDAIRLWNVRDGSLRCTLDEGDVKPGVNVITFDPSGSTLVIGNGDGNIRLWRVSDGALIKTLEARFFHVTDLSVSPDGKTLASCYSAGILVLWNIHDGTMIRTQWPSKAEGPFIKVKFTSNGERLVVGALNGQVRILRASDGTLLRTIGENDLEMNSLALARNGMTLATAHVNGSVRIWRVSDGSLMKSITQPDSLAQCSVAIDSSGQLLAVGCAYWRVSDLAFFALFVDRRDYGVQLYNTSNGTLLHSLKGHKWDVTSTSFSPDGTILATGSSDQSIKLWDVRRFKDGAF